MYLWMYLTTRYCVVMLAWRFGEHTCTKKRIIAICILFRKDCIQDRNEKKKNLFILSLGGFWLMRVIFLFA